MTDIAFFLLFFVMNLSFLTRGPVRYAVLSVFSAIVFFLKKEKYASHYTILFHIVLYIVIGFLLAIINKNISGQSYKQALIYLSTGFIAVSIYHLYDSENTKKLLDLQLYGICTAYTVLYFMLNRTGTLYWESHVFAYILGLYALIYFCQKRYVHMAVSLFYMLMDHKRIADLAFLLVLAVLVLYKMIRNKKYRDIFMTFLQISFPAAAILWIYLMSSNFLSETMKLTDRFTSLRMTLWNSAAPHYEFSLTYIGKGIGFVKNWMVREGVFQLENLHNDFLAAYIELGFFGYIAWLLSFLSIFAVFKNKIRKENLHIGFLFFVYLFINMLTDNTYIYISFMLPFYLILLSLFFGKDSDSFTRFLN